MRIHHLTLAVICGLVSSTHAAEPLKYSLAHEPYTGLFQIPNAKVTDYGQFQFGMSNAVEFNGNYIDGYNYMPTFGLLPGLEVNGRIATRENNSNCFVEGCGIRDLSASAKYQIPFIPSDWFDAAVGARDIGGKVNFYKAYYGVVSKEWWQLRFTAGYGTSDSALGNLNGPFGGIEWQPLSWAQLLAEYDSASLNAGAKLFTPDAWLPRGWQLYLSLQALQQEEKAEKDIWWGAGIKIPMVSGVSDARYQAAGFQPDSNAVENKEQLLAAQQQEQKQITNTASSSSPHASPTAGGAKHIEAVSQTADSGVDLTVELMKIGQKLEQAGFENISLLEQEGKLLIALENNRYNWNELDGLGVAMGIIAEESPEPVNNIELLLLNNKLPVLSISSSTVCARSYLLGRGACEENVPLFAVSTRDLPTRYAPLKEQQMVRNSSALRPRLILAPAIRSFVATDYGVLDYSLALSSNVQVPMWEGALFDVRHFQPLANTDDLDDGRIWEDTRYKSEVDRILMHQAFWLPGNLFTKFSAGRMLFDYDGVENETRWESARGDHRVKFEAAHFTNDKTEHTAKPILVSYRYAKSDWDWAGEVTAGKFWYDDNGYKLTSKHWFGDTEVRLFFRDSKEQMAGLEIAIPLTFRQDMKPTPYGQIRGTEQFAYGVETLISQDLNYLVQGIAVTPALAYNVDQVYFNRDRLSPAYVEANLSRMREAYQKYGK